MDADVGTRHALRANVQYFWQESFTRT